MGKFLNKWHRRFGIVAAAFVIMLVITGLLLNHTGNLNLDHRYVQNAMLLELYNIKLAQPHRAFAAGSHWISKVGERVYFDQIEIAVDVKNLVGAVSLDDEVVIALDGWLLVVNDNGEIIERLGGTEGVPAGMRAMGLTAENSLVVRGSHGDYLVNLDNLDWHEETYIQADWSKTGVLPEPLLAILLQEYRGKGLPLERVIMDIHSGRLLGNLGVYIVDAAAILFFLLALTGLWMWYKNA